MSQLGWSAARVAVASYVGLCILMYWRQAKYIYYPSRELTLTPATAGLAFDDVTLRTTDGETIHGWYVPASGAVATVLFCHGNAGNIWNRIDSIWRFHDLGMNVLIFDYRGYGKSSGTPSELGTYRDAESAWNYLTGERRIPPARIVAFGESLGGAVAAWVAEEKKPGALIVESTFTSVPDLASRFYPILPVRLLCRFRYNTLARMPRIRCPVLVMHSEDDEIVPFAHGRKLFDAAADPKVFFALRGSHNTGREEVGKPYDEAVARFVAASIPAEDAHTNSVNIR